MTMMQIREHRTSLADSLGTVKTIPATLDALILELARVLGMSVEAARRVPFTIERTFLEQRTGWQHCRPISVAGRGVVLLIDSKKFPMPWKVGDPCHDHDSVAYRCTRCNVVTSVVRTLSKIYAIDYDGTITSDIDLWLEFIMTLRARGHVVLIVTMRTAEEALHINPRILSQVDRVIATSRKAKLPFVESLKIKPDIWIDDAPSLLFNDIGETK